GTLERLQPLQRSEGRAALSRALHSRDPRLLPSEIRALGILHPDGSPAVVVIREHDGGAMSATAHALAGVIAGDFSTWLRRASLPQQLGVGDTGLATLVGYHEYMWELLDALVEKGILKVPPVVTSADASSDEMRRLITIVIR